MQDAVAHAGSGGNQVQPELPLQPLLYDLHVQQAQEAAAEPKTERGRVFRLVAEGGVIQGQLFQRVAQPLVVFRAGRVEPGEDHGLDGRKAGQHRPGPSIFSERVAHLRVGHAPNVGGHKAHLAGSQMVHRHRLGCQDPELLDFVHLTGTQQANAHLGAQHAIHHPHLHDGAAVGVEPGVEDQSAQRSLAASARRRDAGDQGIQHGVHARAQLGAHRQVFRRRQAQQVFNLLGGFLHAGGGQVNLVEHRDDFQVVAQGQVGIGQRLGFDPLGSVHQQQGALAGGQRAGDLVGKVHVAGGVNQVELVGVAVAGAVEQADGVGFDGDAPLALQVHGVEDLVLSFPFAQRTRAFQQAVGQGGLAVVDVGNDAEVSDVGQLNHLTCVGPNQLVCHNYQRPGRGRSAG